MCLAKGWGVSKTARECHVGECTIWSWKRYQPAFNERVAEISRAMTYEAIGRLADMAAGKAADKLEQKLDKKDPDLATIKAVYDLLTGLKNSADLAARIEAIEANIKEGR